MKTRRVECEKDERKQKDNMPRFSGFEVNGVYFKPLGFETEQDT